MRQPPRRVRPQVPAVAPGVVAFFDFFAVVVAGAAAPPALAGAGGGGLGSVAGQRRTVPAQPASLVQRSADHEPTGTAVTGWSPARRTRRTPSTSTSTSVTGSGAATVVEVVDVVVGVG